VAITAPVIDVIDPSGRTHRVVGRAAEMVVAILEQVDRINEAPAGDLVFNFGPGSMQPRFTENWRRVK
jgi:hypothetical protein